MLDVACGTGNAAIPAAVAGGEVTGLDITPELFEDGRRRARRGRGRDRVGRGRRRGAARSTTASFDVVALHLRLHVRRRTTRPPPPRSRACCSRAAGWAIAAWRPEGAIGQFFQTIAKHAPPPPPGFQPPPLWGVRDHVAELFAGHRASSSRFEDAAAHWRFDSIAEMVDEYATKFGPIVILRAALEPEGRWRGVRGRPAPRLFEELNQAEDGGIAFDGDYLITLGEKPEG